MMVMPNPSVKSINYVGAKTVVINPDKPITWEGNITIIPKIDNPGVEGIPIKEISYKEDYGHIIKLGKELEPGSYIIKSNSSRGTYPHTEIIDFKTKKKARFLHILKTGESTPEIT